jgi:hypothetical protein
VLAGPKREWLVVLGALVVGAGLLFFTRGRAFSGGEHVSLQITLITSDRHELACGLDHPVAGLRCAFGADGQPVTPAPEKGQLLAPYMTPDRRLLLVPALFEQPALSARYDREVPTGRPRQRLKRFVATCQMELLAKVPQAKVRFGKRGNWDQISDVWVARPASCTVSD